MTRQSDAVTGHCCVEGHIVAILLPLVNPIFVFRPVHLITYPAYTMSIKSPARMERKQKGRISAFEVKVSPAKVRSIIR